MKIKDIAFLSCRFFAIYTLYEGISYFFIFVASPVLFSSANADITGVSIITSAILVAAVISFLLFWFKAEWIASKIVGNHASQEAGAPANVEDMQNAGFAIVGMLVLAKVIPPIANSLAMVSFGLANRNHSSAAYYVELAVQFAIGVALILGASWFSGIIKKLRKR